MIDIERVCAFENLYQAHKKSRRGKQNRREIINYELRLSENLQRLSYHLQRGIYRIKSYNRFIIHDPKTREIQSLSYGDRIVQHSLCDNVLGPYLDKRLIYDNAACRRGKGTHFAMDRLSGFMQEFYRKYGTDGYFLKCDIRKYFDSVDHEVLLNKIASMKLDSETKALLIMIVNSYEASLGKGLPMGNQTSQWFALMYMDGLDRLIKEKLKMKYYTRYMDDLILLHHDREYLKNSLKQMTEYVERELKLSFNEKTQIHHVRQGVDYLGFHFYLGENGKVIKTLRQSGKKRLKRRLKAFKRLYRDGRIELSDIQRSLVSCRGHLKYGNTWRLRRVIWHGFVLKKSAPE